MIDDPYHVYGIDPGGKGGDTGIVLVRFGDNEPATLVDSWAVKGEEEGFFAWYNSEVVPNSVDYVVVEHFVNRNVRGADLTPCFIEGGVMAKFDGQAKVIRQPASGKNTAIPDAAMKRGGYYIPGDHHRDRNEALRHVLFWLKKSRHAPTLRGIFPNE